MGNPLDIGQTDEEAIEATRIAMLAVLKAQGGVMNIVDLLEATAQQIDRKIDSLAVCRECGYEPDDVVRLCH